MLKPEELTRLKKRLPRGYFKKTLEKVDLSERSVAKFFSGEAYNIEIHQAALDVAQEYEAQKQAVIKRQKELTDAKI